MRDKTELNCPNCGAPITGERCEYCGSVLYVVIDTDVATTPLEEFKGQND